MLEETEDISISALISDTNQISYLYSIFKDSLSIEAIFFLSKKRNALLQHTSIIGKTKSAKKIKYGLPFLAVRNMQKQTLFNWPLKRV